MLTQKRVLFGIFRAALFAGCLFLMTPDSLLRPPSVGLDPSWEIAINLAVQNHLRFGQDFVFTFGPLGILTTRLPIGMGHWPLVLFDALMIGMVGLALLYVFRQTKTYFSATLVLLTAVLLDTIPQHTFGLPNILFLLFLFALFFHLRFGDPVSLTVAAIISWVLFYMKANLGLAAVPLMAGFCVYLLFRPRRLSRAFVAIFLAVFLVVGLAVSAPLNVDLPGYVLGGLHLAEGYSDAMIGLFTKGPTGDQFAYLALTILVAYGLAFIADRKHYARDFDSLVRFLLTSVFIFLVFKHSFVRAIGHYGFFYFSVPAAIGLLTVFAAPAVRGRLERVFLLTLICSFPAAAGIYTLDHVTTQLARVRNYGYNVLNPAPGPITNPEWEQQRLPASTLAIIGDGTVDVMPWEISTVYINDLTYNPRPVVQSYTTYDAYLDKLNERKYLSESAPEYIVFSPGDIDNRHPVFIEPRTRRALLTHYRVVQETPDYVLLERRDKPFTVSEDVMEPSAGRLGEFIPLEASDGLQYLTADIGYSLLGNLARTFYQPPLLKATVEFEDGEKQTFRAVKPLINDEVLVNPFFDTVQGAADYFRSNGELGRRVRRVKFYSDKPWAFKPDYTYSLKHMQLRPPSDNSRQLDIDMGSGLRLKSAEAATQANEVDVVLTWDDSPAFKSAGTNEPLTASVQLLDETGNRLTGFDVLLQEDIPSFSSEVGADPPEWRSRHVLGLPADVLPGRYDLLVTVYTLSGDQVENVSSTTLEDFINVD